MTVPQSGTVARLTTMHVRAYTSVRAATVTQPNKAITNMTCVQAYCHLVIERRVQKTITESNAALTK